MVVPAFGFGVGDFIAVSNLVVSVVRALQSTSEDQAELKSIQEQLCHLQELIESVESSIFAGTAISEQNAQKLQRVLASTETLLGRFKTFVDKYMVEPSSFIKCWRRVEYSLGKKNGMDTFRKNLNSYVYMLMLIQNDLNRQEILDTKNQVISRAHDLSTQLQAATQEVRLEIAAVPSDPWDQKPIKFQDPTGRRFPLPLEAVQTFDVRLSSTLRDERHSVANTVQDFMTLLTFAFRDHELSSFVARRDLWLFTPASNTDKWWYLIMEGDWETIRRPGLRLEMSLNQDTYTKPKRKKSKAVPTKHAMCLSCSPPSSPRKAQPLVKFVQPVPHWQSLPETLEFRWLSIPPRYGPISTKPRREIDDLIPSEETSDSDSDDGSDTDGSEFKWTESSASYETIKIPRGGLDWTRKAFLSCR